MPRWIAAMLLPLFACDAESVAASGTGIELAAPTRTSARYGMRYLYWEPGVAIPGADMVSRARAVLDADTTRAILGSDRGRDGFVHSSTDAKKNMVTFQQVVRWRGQIIPVHRAWATVELSGGDRLIYIGTGFRAPVGLPDGPVKVDERAADRIAVAEYAQLTSSAGVVTAHRDRGLRVHRLWGRVDVLAYQVHVEGGDHRAYLILVDAMTGAVRETRQAWIE